MKSSPHKVVTTRDSKGKTLLDVAAARVGPRKGRHVITFMVQWQIALNASEGSSISLQDYADYWQEARPTAFRHQAAFREAFPNQKDPTYLLGVVADMGWDVSTGVAGLGGSIA